MASPASLTSPFSSLVVSVSFARLSPLSSISSVTCPSQVSRAPSWVIAAKRVENERMPGGRNRVGQRLAEIGHDQHAVREDIGKAGRPGEVDVDMDRIVIARGAAIQRQRVARDRRKRLVNDALADRGMIVVDFAHAASWFRTTMVRAVSAT